MAYLAISISAVLITSNILRVVIIFQSPRVNIVPVDKTLTQGAESSGIAQSREKRTHNRVPMQLVGNIHQ